MALLRRPVRTMASPPTSRTAANINISHTTKVILLLQPIAHAGFGFERPWPDRIRFNLMSELVDRDADELRRDLARFPPDFFHQLALSDDATRMTNEDRQQIILQGREMDFLFLQPDAPRHQIHLQPLVLIQGRSVLRLLGGVAE